MRRCTTLEIPELFSTIVESHNFSSTEASTNTRMLISNPDRVIDNGELELQFDQSNQG